MLKRLSLRPELFPVQALFNAIPANGFTEALQAFSQRTGVGYDEVCCEFPGDSEDGSFSGVKFYIFNEEITLSNIDFFKILSIACASQSMTFPDQSEEIKFFLDKIEVNLGIQPN
ncbi:hypothetical protein ACFJIW_13210 [Tahibacter sp. UC22_41]|uniref:hypothetical protein n=1 Tax=Tahibacter sp. UC22_41 TaxID=3350178 RepID=UPI0036DE91D8